VGGLFLAIVHTPNAKIFEDQIEYDEQECIIARGMDISVAGTFTSGDCSSQRYRQTIMIAGIVELRQFQRRVMWYN
jgi:alkyl hydroperoxide reductase subunit AhpF